MTSKIEWLKSADGKPGYTINPVKGLCPVACDYCYARRMYKRFKWDETIRYESGWEYKLPSILTPSKIFVGSTMELFGDWIKPVWRQDILQVAGANPQHTFIFLTKRPENLPKVFPDNCWVGASVTDERMYAASMVYLIGVRAKVKFVSFEPLLSRIDKMLLQNTLPALDWLIIGQQTPVKMSTMPQVGWVEEIVSAADKAKVPVFLKDNLISCVDQYPFAFSGKFPNLRFRQEFPNSKVISFKGV